MRVTANRKLQWNRTNTTGSYSDANQAKKNLAGNFSSPARMAASIAKAYQMYLPATPREAHHSGTGFSSSRIPPVLSVASHRKPPHCKLFTPLLHIEKYFESYYAYTVSTATGF